MKTWKDFFASLIALFIFGGSFGVVYLVISPVIILFLSFGFPQSSFWELVVCTRPLADVFQGKPNYSVL